MPRQKKGLADYPEPKGMKVETSRGEQQTRGTGRKPLCICWRRYACFLIRRKTFIAQCSYVLDARPLNADNSKSCYRSQ
jgi:hypothetical protein